MLSILIIFVALCVIHSYQCFRLRNRPPLLEGAWPIIGHSLLVAKDLQSLIEDMTRSCFRRGIDIATVRLGAWNIFVILNPDDSQLVANSCPNKDSLYNLLKPYFGVGLLTINGHKWLTHRKMLNPTFNQQVLDGYLAEFNNGASELVRALHKEVGNGSFDHFLYLEQSIFVTVCATIIGSIKDDADKNIHHKYKKARSEFFDCVVQRVTKFWLHIDIIYSLCGLKKREDFYSKEIFEITKKILKKKKVEFYNRKILVRDVNTKPYNVFVDQLFQLSEDGLLTEQEVFEEMNSFITGATDTLSIALPIILLCVGSYEHVQQRIVDELQTVFGDSDRDLDKEDLSKLKYLEAVIKEALRLYPTIPLIGRQLDRDLKIKNYIIPSGSKCYILLHALLRHPLWGADSTQFRPERWLDGTLPASCRVNASFGIGKRRCIGANFAMMLMKTYLCRFLRKYSVSGDVTSLQQCYQVLSRPMRSYNVSIELRI